MKAIYTTHAHSSLGANEHVQTDDKQLSLKLSKPGSGQPGINPEQLFACGYSACFGMAMKYISKELSITLNDFHVDTEVILYKDEVGFLLEATLNVKLPNMDKLQAEKLIEAAHKICPYSRAVKNNIKVTTKINGEVML